MSVSIFWVPENHPKLVSPSSDYLQIIQNVKFVVFWVITRRRVVIIYRRFMTTYPERVSPSSGSVTLRHVTHSIWDGTVKVKPSKQRRRQTDQSICLMQVKETAEHHTASIHPSISLLLCSLRHATPRQAGAATKGRRVQ
jgi:hypothetical protein